MVVYGRVAAAAVLSTRVSLPDYPEALQHDRNAARSWEGMHVMILLVTYLLRYQHSK
jgi:hypothetical protein